MNQALSDAQLDMFDALPVATCPTTRLTTQRTPEQRKMLSEGRFAREFSMTSLFAEIGTEPVSAEDYDESEGFANAELDSKLRVSNSDLSSVSDHSLSTFVEESHRACLELALNELAAEEAGVRVLREKGFTLQWIFCVDTVRGKTQSQIPYSFLNCCLASGVDPDRLRGALLQMEVVRDLLVRLRLVERSKLPQLRPKVYYADIVGHQRAAVRANDDYACPLGDSYHVDPKVLALASRISAGRRS